LRVDPIRSNKHTGLATRTIREYYRDGVSATGEGLNLAAKGSRARQKLLEENPLQSRPVKGDRLKAKLLRDRRQIRRLNFAALRVLQVYELDDPSRIHDLPC
jgi:hypothetical protein